MNPIHHPPSSKPPVRAERPRHSARRSRLPRAIRPRISSRSLAWLSVLLIILWAGPALAGDALWLLVDTEVLELRVMRGQEVVHTYDNIAIGRTGTSAAKRRGDDKTPLGEFRIVRITEDSPFHLFLGLDYPDMGRAERAYRAGQLTRQELQEIETAARERREPPQHTALGGYIGIHGLGEGDPAVHRRFNWTHGCIALTNEQIEDLRERVDLGTSVVIR